MGAIGAILEHPEDLLPLIKLKLAVRKIEKQIPIEPHWAFSYTMLQKVSRSFAIVIQQLKPDLRNAVTRIILYCLFFLFFLLSFLGIFRNCATLRVLLEKCMCPCLWFLSGYSNQCVHWLITTSDPLSLLLTQFYLDWI